MGDPGAERHVTYRDTVHALATGLLVAAGVSAVGNWIAVARGSTVGIYVFKPLTLVLMIAAALALDPTSDAARAWFVVALVFSLLGDVFLMLPTDAFVAGLSSFLLAHVAYVVGLNQDSAGNWWLAVPVVVVAAVLGSPPRGGDPTLRARRARRPGDRLRAHDPRDGGERGGQWQCPRGGRRAAVHDLGRASSVRTAS